jgi:hypothetical protein
MNQLLQFDTSFSYTQIVICNPALENPFNDWEPEHIRQGFAWREGSVSFGVFDSNLYTVEVILGDSIQTQIETERAILVPFTVPAPGLVGIATVGDMREVKIREGTYALLFEHGHKSDIRTWRRFTFVPQRALPEPAVLIADAYLSPSRPLLMSAKPA